MPSRARFSRRAPQPCAWAATPCPALPCPSPRIPTRLAWSFVAPLHCGCPLVTAHACCRAGAGVVGDHNAGNALCRRRRRQQRLGRLGLGHLPVLPGRPTAPDRMLPAILARRARHGPGDQHLRHPAAQTPPGITSTGSLQSGIEPTESILVLATSDSRASLTPKAKGSPPPPARRLSLAKWCGRLSANLCFAARDRPPNGS
jgi:hypothetical protein